jgi:hypothetical protein
MNGHPHFVFGSPSEFVSRARVKLNRDFAINVAIAYQIGAARGDHSILSPMDIGDSEIVRRIQLKHRRLDPAPSHGSGNKARNQGYRVETGTTLARSHQHSRWDQDTLG